MINFIEITNELFKNSFVNKLTVEVVSLRLLLAVVFGGIVGYTREKDNKPAGFRTHILVCFGAAIISMVQDQLRLNILELASINLKLSGVIKTDLGRLGAQVVSGIGFLGAGSIMKEKGETVGGMTTAAGIWATGCAGLGIGWGFYNLAIPAIVFMLVIIVIFKKFEPKIVKKTKLLKFEVKFLEDKNYAKGLLATYEVFNQKLIKITQIDKNEAENTVIFTVNMDEKIDISDIIVSLSAIKAVEVVKENYN
ncbi:MgtC/SapB family protein [Leptotrichia sp. oral taxon 879]|uniref:MgtC/SapB family protein n=1 Tax=Leptotrichia sp. oral taxon 879 TaxID=1227267 RepID=UPI0003AE7606|nr:MgtC/SapB family protein [Leptotrichia sp. oral taxon 879]ERK52428.1 Mg2+ transporter-C family protein [Leptotrichia sp. oral taxon 879 str. F0557]